MALLKQSTAFRRYFFIRGFTSTSVLAIGSSLALAPDGVTGLTIGCQIMKAGGSSFADPAGGALTLTEIANGWYYGDFGTADSDTIGILAYQLLWNAGANAEGDYDQVGAGAGLGGASVELAMRNIVLTNPSGTAFYAAGGSNGKGILAIGDSGGAGIQALGGSDGPGAQFSGGASSGAGVAIATSNGIGLFIAASSSDAAMKISNSSTGDGLQAAAGSGGYDFHATITPNSPAGGCEVGTASAGSGTTITLRSGASATNNLYKGQAIVILGGTGAGQTNKITAYVGSTKVATVETTWVTNPANDSVYAVLGRIE